MRDTDELRRLADKYRKSFSAGEKALAEALDQILLVVAEYEGAITWDTTCLSCSRVLDAAIRDYERAEKAESELDAAREREDVVSSLANSMQHSPLEAVRAWGADLRRALDGE